MSDDLLDLIREHVTIFEMLEEFRPESYAAIRSRTVGHKIPCPFAAQRHGKASDNRPSAKFFPENNSVYCWSCHGSWDVIALYAEANEQYKLDDQGRPLPDGRGGNQLDYGRAAADLAKRKGLEFKAPDWYRRLKASVRVLSQPPQAMPHTQWEKLCRNYRDRLCTWAFWSDDPLDRVVVAEVYAHVLDSIPLGGQPGAERDLHTWFEWAQSMLTAQATRAVCRMSA